MIASLRGTVLSVRENTCIVDVNGVGYAVNITPAHKFALTVGSEHSFLTSLIVREDSMTLFGFENPESLELFELLLSVSGVGPKTAKLIIVQLAGKLTALAHTESVTASAPVASPIAVSVVQALVGLGWNEKIARDAVDALDSAAPSATTASVLKEALASLARNS